MTIKLKASADGCAIYETTAGDAPFTAPLSHLDKLKFHSSLDYVEHRETVAGTVALSAVTRGTVGVVSTAIYAHGMGAAPMVLGYWTVSGMNFPMAGMTPIQQVSTATFDSQFRRSLFVSCDATYVYLGQSIIARGPASSAIEFSAVSVGYTLYICNRTMPYTAPTYTNVRTHMEANYVLFGGGRSASRKKYFRAVSTGGAPLPAGGKTMTIANNVSRNRPFWGYNCAGIVFNSFANSAAGFSPASATRITP